MNFNIIASGSTGNAVIVNKSILIDCGVTFKKLKPYYKDLKIVLLTHVHSDHFRKDTIMRLAKERPTLRFACGEWLYEDLKSCWVSPKNIDVLKIGVKYDYGAFQVSPVKLYHNVPNCGYRLFIGSEKALYCTDTNTLDGISAKNYDYYLLEANYGEQEIQERIKRKEAQGIYPYEYNVLHCHLSKEKCDEFLYKNMGDISRYIYMHRHKDK